MEEHFGLKDIVKTLKKHWKLIFSSIMVAITVSAVLSFYVMTPVYQASTQILVSPKNDPQLDVTQLRSNIELINTYSAIIKSPNIVEKVKEKLKLSDSVEEINQNIIIKNYENSQVFYLIVQNENAGKAAEIANSLSETFQREIQGIMNVDNVNILANAEVKDDPTPVKPSPMLNIAIAVILGLMVGTGISFLLEFLDGTLKEEQDIEKTLGLPVLGTIKKVTRSDKKRSKGQVINNLGGE